MSQLNLEPLYLIDENLSPSLAHTFGAVGFNVISVAEAFQGRGQVSDEQIIGWLGQQGQQNAVWVTADDDAQKAHAKLILASLISVLWILRPRTGLTALQELKLLSLIISDVNAWVLASTNPVYFRASLNVRRPKLEQVISPLTSRRLEFKRIQLTG